MIEEMSKEELFSLWESNNDSEFPAARSKNSPLDPFYPITDYFVKLQDGLPIAAIGYGKKGEFTTRGGAFVIESERGNNHYQELDRHLERNTSGPYITGISSTVMPNEEWAKSFEKRGWSVTPTDEELGKYANDNTIKAFKEYYDDHPRGAKWAVKGLPLAKGWWNIIKNLVDIRSAEQYERASPDDRRRWHLRQYKAYDKRLKNLQAKVNVTDEESPLYQEMVKLQEILRFHGRQVNRLRVKPPNKSFYSLELETNRRKTKGQQTPHGNPMPYKELSQEVYETLTRAEKIKYHMSMYRKSEGEEKTFHGRMYSRLRKNNSPPTFAASKYGGEKIKLIETTREEYENMSNQEKRNYHGRMYRRNRRIGNKDMTQFHSSMIGRLQRNSKLPVFYSPEDM